MAEKESRQPDIRKIGEWVVRERRPAGQGPHPVILLLHGWTGDENSMWVFTSRLPEDAWLIAPRAVYKSPSGGYSWRDESTISIQENITLRRWPAVEVFLSSIESLKGLLSAENFPGANLDQFSLVGFSQGGALAYTFALINPGRVRIIAGLSTFVPEGAETLALRVPLPEKHIFVAHGLQDDLVPVDKARQSAALLEQAGSIVTYCEDNVGHKLGVDCFCALEDFFLKYW